MDLEVPWLRASILRALDDENVASYSLQVTLIFYCFCYYFSGLGMTDSILLNDFRNFDWSMEELFFIILHFLLSQGI